MIEYVDRRGSDCYKWDSDHVRSYMMPENQERPENQETVRFCTNVSAYVGGRYGLQGGSPYHCGIGA